jgi:tetratricopeptide (TPR) repeat protein
MAAHQAGRLDEAVAALENATVRYPDDDMAWVNLGYARGRLGEHERAIAALREARRANPDGGRATADLVNLLSGTGRGDEALALADSYLAAHPGERHVLAALGLAWRDAGREDEAQALLDPDRFIRVLEPPVPKGYASIADFNAALRSVIVAEPSLRHAPSGTATRNGLQTGDLDLAGERALAAWRGLVEEAVRATGAALAAAGLAQHPLMAYAAPRWSLRAWGTLLEAGGRQAPHIHPQGWLSGVYYVDVPPGMDSAGPTAGWLEFGAPPERLLVARDPAVRSVEPRPGRLLIFPSYFYHRTLPFTAAGSRISMAFDVVPRK